MKRVIAASVLAAAFPAALCAAPSDKAEKVPLYLWQGQDPYSTVEAAADDAYEPGDLVAVAGVWRAGGLPGGAVLRFTVHEPAVGEKNVLNKAPVDVRYFYVDVLPEEAAEETSRGFARARGLVADDDLYAYAYILRPQAIEVLPPPAWNEEAVRATLSALRKDIRKIKLDRLTGDAHREYNKGYKIVADVDAAEVDVEAVDYERDLAVARARFERLPPEDSDVLFRYLDVYVVADAATGEALWAVACVGGFYLE
jgi:hypothetical protein